MQERCNSIANALEFMQYGPMIMRIIIDLFRFGRSDLPISFKVTALTSPVCYDMIVPVPV